MQVKISINYSCQKMCISFAVIVVAIIAIIWYCKHSQKYYVTTNVRSDIVPKITNPSTEVIELETNPSYGTLRKEAQQNVVDYPPVDDEGANPSYTAFLNKEDDMNPQHIHATTKISNLSAEAVDLETNPSYGTLRKEAQQCNVDYPPIDLEVYLAANPSYTPFLKSEDEVNSLCNSAQDVQDLAYDYI